MIGEFQRQSHRQRVAYLCLNKQLARQAFHKLQSYGIPSVLFEGPVAKWRPDDRTRYTSGEAIAVSVYHHVFNSNPALNDVQYMILDDAHSAESAVVGPWNMEFDRSETIYTELLELLRPAFAPDLIDRLLIDASDRRLISDVFMASPIATSSIAVRLEEFLRSAVEDNRLDARFKFVLSMLTGHIGKCQIYVSYRKIQIRPFIVPTQQHEAFESPAQRLYLSATLGAGGELERAFGRHEIKRIPLPTGWEKKGTGRRFFCFPELSNDASQDSEWLRKWLAEALGLSSRLLVISPDSWSSNSFKDEYLGSTDLVHAEDVEVDLSAFTDRDNAALVLANRYDGIDLPDDDCRIVVLNGLPARGDLQERFLVNSLGASEVLQERIRARVVQGSGRASRSSNDYSAVVMLGADLSGFCAKKEVTDALLPELSAEISFGLHQSIGESSQNMLENLRHFMRQDSDWEEVELEIERERDGIQRADPPGTEQLARAARHEVDAYHSYWQGETERALEKAKLVIDSLSGGRAPQRYAALWNYFAANWSAALGRSKGNSFIASSNAYYKAARSSGRGTLWLNHLTAPLEAERGMDAKGKVDLLDSFAATAILNRLGMLGSKFEPRIERERRALSDTQAKPFESALVFLGKLLGASESDGNNNASAAPDAAWQFGDGIWIVLEAKSEAQPNGELGAEDVRQAGSHLRFMEDHLNRAHPGGSFSLIVTPQQKIHPASRAVAEAHVFVTTPETMLELFDRSVKVWRTLRARGANTLTEEDVLAVLQREDLLPTQWIKLMQKENIGNREMEFLGD